MALTQINNTKPRRDLGLTAQTIRGAQALIRFQLISIVDRATVDLRPNFVDINGQSSRPRIGRQLSAEISRGSDRSLAHLTQYTTIHVLSAAAYAIPQMLWPIFADNARNGRILPAATWNTWRCLALLSSSRMHRRLVSCSSPSLGSPPLSLAVQEDLQSEITSGGRGGSSSTWW